MKKIKKLQGVFLLSLNLMNFLFSGCIFENPKESGEIEKQVEKKQWTFLVYMAADNNLEGSAIKDFNEMEESGFDEDKINVLVLLDRAEGNDASNGDWSDTRLFELKNDRIAPGLTISSLRLDCPELSLSCNSQTELDMADKETVSLFVEFALKNYPAEKNAFIVWGHGSGWRGENYNGSYGYKYFAADDYSGNSISLTDLAGGLEKGLAKVQNENPEKKAKFDFIGFDTCFGLTFETALQMENVAYLAGGTPALEDGDGWNYGFLGEFCRSDLSVSSLAEILARQFSSQYSSYQYGCFSVVDTAKTAELTGLFSDYCFSAAALIKTSVVQNALRNCLETEVLCYDPGVYPCDVYIDVWSFVKNTCQCLEQLKNAGCFSNFLTDEGKEIEMFFAELSEKSEKIFELMEETFVAVGRTNAEKSSPFPFGVFYGNFTGENVPSLNHPSGYVQDSKVSGKCRFVENCPGYVPGKDSMSFLEKLFYAVLE